MEPEKDLLNEASNKLLGKDLQSNGVDPVQAVRALAFARIATSVDAFLRGLLQIIAAEAQKER